MLFVIFRYFGTKMSLVISIARNLKFIPFQVAPSGGVNRKIVAFSQTA